MDVSLSGSKRKKAKKEKPYVSIEFDILKPGGHKYTEIDYQELKRQNSIVEETSLDEDLHNVGAVDFIRRLEAKYSKKGKKYRFEEDDIANKNYDGYDDEEGFIDDSEAFEEQLPSTMETFKGGFYVNRGSLELKELNESQLAIDDDEDDEEEESVSKSATEEKKKEEKKKVVEPVRMVGAPPSLSRMVGGPPTMKRAFSEADRMANEAKKKKVVTSTVAPVQSVAKKVSPPSVVKQNTSDSVIVLDDDSSVKKSTPSVIATTSIPSTTTAPITPTKSTPKPTPEKVATTSSTIATSTNSTTLLMQQKVIEFYSISQTLPEIASEQRKALINKLCAEFVTMSVKYFTAGKKQLDNAIIDVVLKIDEFYKKEHSVTKLQRQKVQEQLASFLSVNRATLASKMQARINELDEKKKSDKDDDIQVISTKPSSSSTGVYKVKLGDVKHWTQDDVNKMNDTFMKLRVTRPSTHELAYAYALQEANNHRLSVACASQKIIQFKPTPDLLAALTPLIPSAPVAKPTRKSRVYLNVWVKESQEYWNLMLKKANKVLSTFDTSKLAEIREVAVKTLKASSEKSKETHRKAVEDAHKNSSPVPNFSFNFSDTLIGSLSAFIDEIYNLSLAQNKPNLAFSALTSLHELIKDDVNRGMFFIEICRRIPKIAFVLELPELKKILSDAKLFVEKFQVVQNLKYVLKWPEGTGPGSKVVSNSPQLVASTSSTSTSSIKPIQTTTSKSAVSLNQQPSTSSASAPKSNATTPQKLAQCSPEKVKATEQLVFAQLITRLQQNPSSAALLLTNLRAQYGDAVIKMLEERMRQTQLEEQERKRKEELEKQRKIKEELERQRKVKDELERQRKIKEELEKQRKIKEELEKRKKLEEAERRRKAEEAERARKLAEEKRKAKLEEKLRKEKEAKEKREREIREARERKEREERERQEAQEALRRIAEEQRKKKEAEELARIEEERRIRLEREAAEVLENLEQDNMMEELEFNKDKELRMEQEKLESEKAAERARELERMRSRQREEEREMKPVVSNVQSTSSYSNTNQYVVVEPPPIRVKQELVESVVTRNPQSSYPTTTSQNFNNYTQQQNSFQNGSNGMQNHQIASSSSSEYLGSPQMVPQSQNSMMGQSPQHYMMSPSRNNTQQYAQNIIQQNMMYGIQQQQQQMMRQQHVQPPVTQHHQQPHQQQQYGWNNMIDQQQQQRQNQSFAAAQLHQQQQLQRQLQMQQQQQLQQQQQQFQQNFHNYGNGYNNPR